nr:PEPxxWA-CTERM sorting domain-containing protein [uncultured Sphingomonas sp.]
MARKLLALLLLVFATPAYATSYVGTISGFDYLYIPIPFGPGTYQLSFAFSGPVPFDVTIHTEEHYTTFDPYTGDYGGNDEYYDYTYPYGSQTRSGSVRWTIAPPYTYNFGGMITHGYFNGTYADFNFTGDPDRTITYYLGITAVPEPGQWGLMLGGFGLAGAALRRRRRARLGAMTAS